VNTKHPLSVLSVLLAFVPEPVLVNHGIDFHKEAETRKRGAFFLSPDVDSAHSEPVRVGSDVDHGMKVRICRDRKILQSPSLMRGRVVCSGEQGWDGGVNVLVLPRQQRLALL